MIATTIGQASDSFEAIYSKNNVSGVPPLNFTGHGMPLQSWTISGNSIQNGTPSLDNPVEVESVGDKTENLFDKDSPDVVRGKNFNETGTIRNAAYAAITGYIPIKPDTFYSMFPKNGTSGWYGVFYDSEKNQISTFNVSGGGDGTSGQYIYKSPSNASYARLTVLNTEYYPRTMYVEGTEELVLSNIIPYGYKIPVTIGNVTTPIYIGSEPLRKALDGSDAVDSLDYATQTITRRVDSNYEEQTPVTTSITLPTLIAPSGETTLSVDTTIQPSNVAINGEYEIVEIYGGLNYADPIFYKSQTLTGTAPLTFDAYPEPLTSWSISGNSYQDGTPSPEQPVEVQCVGDKTENLWDGYLEIGGLNGSNGEEYNPDTHYYVRTNYLPLLKSDHPVLCVKVNGVYIRNIFMYDENKIRISTVSSGYFDNGSGCVFSLLNACRYIRMCFQSDAKPCGTNENSLPEISVNNVNQLMINDGNTPMEYEPPGYKIPITLGGVTQTVYLDEPLYRVGDYADEIDFSNQQIIRRVKKLVLDGTEYWSQMSSTTIFWISAPSQKSWNANNICIAANGYKAIKSIYGAIDTNKLKENEVSCRLGETYINDQRYTTVESFKDYLATRYSSGNPIILYYPFRTPTATSITLPTLTPTTGSNTLSIGTTLQPSAVSITGHIKPTGYGQLVDVNNVDILDSNGTPIYVHGQGGIS